MRKTRTSLVRRSRRSTALLRLEAVDLDTDVFHESIESCVSFLDSMIDSWDIDLKTFSIEIVLNPRLSPSSLKRFEFVEMAPGPPLTIEPGFEQFPKDKSLSGDATEEKIEFLKRLKFTGKRPAPIYYYRELQNLRDPLHFPTSEQPRASD